MKNYFRFLTLPKCLACILLLLTEVTSAADSTANPGTYKVIKVFKAGVSAKESARAGIGDIIVVELDSLANFTKAVPEPKIRLFIDGRKIDSIGPIPGTVNRADNTIQFNLDRNPANDKTWASILGAPGLFGRDFFEKKAKISVGPDNGSAITTSGDFTLIRIDEAWFIACLFIVVVYLFVFGSMSSRYGLLRDRPIDLSAIGISTSGWTNTYSLGRFQMAFWFTLTVISFLFIWLITDAYNIITTTVLTLMGISATTSISGAVIDNSKQQDLLNQTITQQNDLTTVSKQIVVLQSQMAAVPAPVNLTELQTQLTTALTKQGELTTTITNNKKTLTPIASEGFFKDILQDSNGVSFHRLQMFTWTLVMGMIFIYSVWKSLSMPDFDGTLLALQGITAGTYLGFKFPEK